MAETDAENEQQREIEEIKRKILRREKLQVYSLIILAILTSFIVRLGINFQLFPLVALVHFEFYRSLFTGVLLLAVVPYLVAYFSGRLLNLISYLIRGEQQYPTQYFIAWILFFTFSYFLIATGLDSRENYQRMMQQCQRNVAKSIDEKNNKVIDIKNECSHRVLTLYPKVRHCGVWKTDKKRSECVYNILKKGNLL